MTWARRIASPALAVGLAVGLIVGAAGCTDDQGPSTGAPSTSTPPGSGGTGDEAAGGVETTSTVARREVDTCASITADDLTGLGVPGLSVDQIQDVSGALQGAAQGGTGCLFSLGVDGGGSAGLTILSHPDGGAYFDATVARLAEAAPIPGLGDDARSGHDRPGSTIVITRRGSRVVEVRIGRDGVLDPNLLIAIAGLALEREDGP
ncbi:MAG: hypothetical protein KF703_06030 [Actinobacteria bacterium]|nr:hypothetical protein [Actinomycetota bacterium]